MKATDTLSNLRRHLNDPEERYATELVFEAEQRLLEQGISARRIFGNDPGISQAIDAYVSARKEQNAANKNAFLAIFSVALYKLQI